VPPVAEPPLGAFRAEARAVIESYLADAASHGGAAERSLAVFHETSGEKEAAEVAAARDWQRSKARHGLAWVTGPVEFGGRSLHDRYERALRQLESEYPVPDTSPLRIGIGTVAPAILGHGTTGQQEEYLRPIHAGDVIACQLFSEPEAGSDLAALRTTARRGDDGTWRVTGQKVWTSNAQFADIGMLIARTGEQAGRHRTLTVFLVDMRAPGIDVRPLRQMTGGASFNEVFLDDVAIPDARRLGPVDGGWAVVRTALFAERGTTGVRYQQVLNRALEALAQDMRTNGLGGDILARQAFARAHILVTVAELTNREIIRGLDDPGRPGPPPGLGRLLLSAALTGAGDAAMTIAGPHVLARGAWPEQFEWARFLLGAPGMRIGGGTDEIVRNTIAESVLGLPREPRPPT
jgi:alkylation response protein AidB-like acyl-CoA dehydrogenase